MDGVAHVEEVVVVEVRIEHEVQEPLQKEREQKSGQINESLCHYSTPKTNRMGPSKNRPPKTSGKGDESLVVNK